jgi:hypothetical protein
MIECVCPACGYPTINAKVCAACLPTAVPAETDALRPVQLSEHATASAV